MGEVDGISVCSKVLSDDILPTALVPANINIGDYTRFMLCIFFSACSLNRTLKSINTSVHSKGRLLHHQREYLKFREVQNRRIIAAVVYR